METYTCRTHTSINCIIPPWMASGLRSILLFCAVFGVVLSQPVWAAKSKIHILVIHSYHENLPWSKGLNKGINKVLKKSSLPVEIHAEYLDNIRHLRKDLFPVLAQLYKDKYEKMDIKAIVTTDDPALDFILEYRDSIFSEVPVVFCGPNRLKPSRIKGQKNITGVSEQNDVKIELETIMAIMPQVRRIGLISDRAPAGKREIDDVFSFKDEFKGRLEIFLTTNESLESVKAEIKGYKEDTAFIYMSFLQDKNGRNYSSNLEVLKELAQETKKPLFTFKKIFVGKGAVGGMLISEELMATSAAEMVVQIITGIKPSDIPIIYKPETLPKFDYLKLVELGIDEKLLPKNYVLMNKPFSFYEEYKMLVLSVTSVLSILLTLVVLLSINTVKRKKAEAQLLDSEAKYRSIFENSSEGIFQANANWELINVNPKFKKILGFDEAAKDMPSSKDIISSSFLNNNEMLEFLDLLTRRKTIAGFDAQLKRVDNKRVWVSISARGIKDYMGKLLFYEGSIVDITEKRERQEAERERDAARVATKAKSEFLASMSHEIRTPMNAILGMADLVWETRLDPEQKKFIGILKGAGESLLNIINDILDLSKVEAGELTLEEIDFNLLEVVEKVCEIMALKAHEKKLEMICDIGPQVPEVVVGDPVRLRQVLTNLIGNALKFTSSGEIFVNVENGSSLESETVDICFTVKDTGIGIPKRSQESIFDSFRQVEASTTRQFGGTGLGLAICKKLVRLMGGKLWVESEEGIGSSFFFTCRFGSSQNQTQPEQVVQQTDLNGLNALIVDDNETNRLILSRTLSGWGVKVTEADSGAKALDILKNLEQNAFDLVILDGHMPGMDGIETADRIKKEAGSAGKTIMMLTSDDTSNYLDRAKKLDIPVCLVKPVKKIELKDAAAFALGKTTVAEKKEVVETQTTTRPLRILLVEDNPDNRTLFEFYLKKSEHKIDIAENGMEGVKTFQTSTYDIVFMDHEMPVMDGFEATKQIRAWEAEHDLPQTPVISLTAHAMKGMHNESLSAGCNHFMTKPFKKKELLEVLGKYAG